MIHKQLAAKRWQTLSLLEQLANIGSEVSRTARYQNKDKQAFENAFKRALELFDLTLTDRRWRQRLKEVARARELFCAAALGEPLYQTTLADLDRYFYYFALAARALK